MKRYSGLKVLIPLTEKNVPIELKGCTLRLTRPVTSKSRIHSVLGMTHITWEAKVVEPSPRMMMGRIVSIADAVGINMPGYPGSGPGTITFEQLLRTCHVDPETILGPYGS